MISVLELFDTRVYNLTSVSEEYCFNYNNVYLKYNIIINSLPLRGLM